MARIPKDYIALGEIKLWDKNYNEGDVGALSISFRKFGYNGVIVIWNGIGKAGNHSVMALRAIKASGPNSKLDRAWPPDQILVQGDEWYARFVDISDLSEIEADAFAVAANRLARLSVFDEKRLSNLLQRVADVDRGLLVATGYDGEGLDEMLRRVTEMPTLSDDLQEPDQDSNEVTNEDTDTPHVCPECGHRF